MQSNEELIQHLIKKGVLKTKHIIEAFQKIDRKNFILDTYINDCYADRPLPILGDQTISQPTTVAIMLELLQPQKGNKILDVGTGSGWTTALLSYIVGDAGDVSGVELQNELVQYGQDNLKKYSFPHASITKAEATLGLIKHAPFNKILVSAASNDVPDELINQLKNNGTMVIPVKNDMVVIFKNSKGHIHTQKIWGFSFVPLIQSQT